MFFHITSVWSLDIFGFGVILKILNFLGFPGNFIFCKTGPKVFAYFTGVLSHYWGIIIHQTKPDSSGYQEVKGFWDPSTYSWEKAYFTNVRNFGTHCRYVGSFLSSQIFHNLVSLTRTLTNEKKLISNRLMVRCPTWSKNLWMVSLQVVLLAKWSPIEE